MNSKKLIFNVTSRLFQPINIVPQQVPKSTEKLKLPKNQRLMLDQGIIRPSKNGVHTILPLGMRALEKFRIIVKEEMSKIYAQELKLPYLADSSLWKKSGRWDNAGLGIFMLKDRHKNDLILSPTNEEMAADLIASIPQLSHHHLPLLLYQITTKFRDELKPRCGLLKTKEFEMKDLYSFDTSVESAKTTYETVSNAYKNIFNRINVPVIRVSAEPGDMKGLFSHEYHVQSDLGEDKIFSCNDCSFNFNSENREVSECLNCKSKSLSEMKGIEVGHTFLLGTVYSDPLNAQFQTALGKMESVVMASYGLGLTRILAAGIECLSSDENIVWPASLAPFSIVIITPKSGSRDYEHGKRLSQEIYEQLNNLPRLWNDVLIDDRENLTIGKRLLYAKRTGYPIVLVIGLKATCNPPQFELHDTVDNLQKNVTFEEIISIFSSEPHDKTLRTLSFQS